MKLSLSEGGRHTLELWERKELNRKMTRMGKRTAEPSASLGGCDFYFPCGLWPESSEEYLPESIAGVPGYARDRLFDFAP